MSQRIDLLEGLETENVQVKEDVATSLKKQDANTRARLAPLFTKYYFRILILIIVGIPLYNLFIFWFTKETELLISLKDTILTFSAVLGSTFGLVIAYYFQTKENR